MRILHLMGTFHLGGSEEFVIDLAIWLRAAGHDVHVATVWTNPLGGEYANAQRQRLVRAGVPFSELGLSSFRRSIPLLPYRVTRVIDAFEPDLVQSHTDLPDFTVALTRPLRRIALARTIHNSVFWPTHPHVGYFVERSFNDELLFAVSSDAMEAHDRFRAGYKLAPSCNRSVLTPGILVPTDGELAIRRASRNSDRKRRIAFLA